MNAEEPDREQVGLLLVDLQTGVFQSSEISPAHDSETLLANARALLEAARRAGVPILHVQHCGAPGDVLERGAPGWPIYPPLSPQAGEAVVQKSTSDAFENTGLLELLRQRGMTALVVTGIQSEHCVATTCRRAVALGCRVLLARDGHGTWPDDRRTAPEIVEQQNHELESIGVELWSVRAIVDRVLR